MKQSSYYATIPGSVRYDAALCANAKLLYGEITALANSKGFCWAGNEYFAELYNVSKETISRWVSQLNEAGHIDVEILRNEGNKRRITIDKKIKRSPQKSHDLLTKKSIPLDENVNPINRMNNTINNTMNREGNALDFLSKNYATRFEAFCMQHKSKLGSDWQAFVDDYNCKVIEEKLDWDADVLFARLTRLSNNWQRHQVSVNIGDRGKNLIQVNNPSGQKIEFKKRN